MKSRKSTTTNIEDFLKNLSSELNLNSEYNNSFTEEQTIEIEEVILPDEENSVVKNDTTTEIEETSIEETPVKKITSMTDTAIDFIKQLLPEQSNSESYPAAIDNLSTENNAKTQINFSEVEHKTVVSKKNIRKKLDEEREKNSAIQWNMRLKLEETEKEYQRLEKENNTLKDKLEKATQKNRMQEAIQKSLEHANQNLQAGVNFLNEQNTFSANQLDNEHERNDTLEGKIIKLEKDKTILQEKIRELNKENEKLKHEKANQCKEILILKQKNTGEKEGDIQLQETEKNLESIKNDFLRIVDAYIKNNEHINSSFYNLYGLFRPHGQYGRTAAYNFYLKFQEGRENIHSLSDLLDYLKELKTDNENYLTGNYHPDSFKTYLLAYYDRVKDLKDGAYYQPIQDMSAYVKNYVEKNYKNNDRSKQIKDQYEAIFNPTVFQKIQNGYNEIEKKVKSLLS